MLIISPLEFNGLFQYWSDFEEKSITSIRYSIGDFSSPNAAVFSIWKTSQESLNVLVNKIEDLCNKVIPGSTYMENLEKLGGYLEDVMHFYHSGFDSAYSGLRKLADSKLPLSLVKIAISALEGELHGLMEAKAALKVVSHILEMPRLAKNFLESSGLAHLLLLATHQLSSSQLIIKIIQTFHSLLSVPSNSVYFFEKDVTSGLDPKLVSMTFTFPRRLKKEDGKKQKTEEETCCKTAYQVLLGLLNEKKSIKVTNAIKVLMNKCAFFYSLQKFCNLNKADESCIGILESIRKNMKLHMLRSSSHSFNGVKHELLNFVLLDSGLSLANLQDSVQFLSQSILTNSLADWLSYTNFLPNLLSLFIFQSSTLEDFRIAFINISDILLMIIRSQGGFLYLTSHAEVLTGFIQAFQGLQVPCQTEEADFNILEEEYLLSVISLEKLSSYSKQLAQVLKIILKISEYLLQIKNGEVLNGLSGLYSFIHAEDISVLASSTFYTILKFQPDLLVWLTEQVDLSNDIDKLKSFYIIELVKIVLIEDRSGEILVGVGQDLNEIFSNVSSEVHYFKESLEVIIEWLAPVCKGKNIDPEQLISDICEVTKQKKDKNSVSIENKATFLVIEENNDQAYDLSFFGELSYKGSVALKILPSLRVLNLVISCRKWTSINYVNRSCLPVLTNLISRATQILHIMTTKPNSNEVFMTLEFPSMKQDLLEIIMPCINIFNIILQQLLVCELLMYNNSPLLESLIHLSALCEVGPSDPVKSKLVRMIKASFILWAQMPNFCDVYLPVLFEHVLQHPFKKSAVLNIIGSIFEFLVSSKDPSFHFKCVEWIAKDHSIPLFNPNLVYQSIVQCSGIENEFKTLAYMQLPYSKVKDSNSSRHEMRNAWEHKRLLSVLLDGQGSVIDRLFRVMFNTNDYDIHLSFLKIVRCILTTNHLPAGKPIVEFLKRMLKEKNNFKGKAIFIIHALSDIPFAKALMINEDIPEILISLITLPEFTKIVIKIFENLFNSELTTSDDEKFTYSEDLPKISQICAFVLAVRDLMNFNVPGGEDMTMDEDDDQLYGEFKKSKSKTSQVPIEVTQAVLNTLKVLSNSVVGRSLIICGHYPYRESSYPIEFTGFLRRLHIGLAQGEYKDSCLSLLSTFISILKNIGTNVLTAENLANLSSQLKDLDSSKGNSILTLMTSLPKKPDIQYIELPKARDLSNKFPSKSPDFEKIKEFSKGLKKIHSNQLVLGKRFGEKTQVKPIQYLTDLLPPPYPPQFKFKPEFKKDEWMVFAEPHQELNTIKVQERQRVFEEKLKKAQPPQGYAPTAQVEIMMPKAPIQQMVPMHNQQQQYTRSMTLPSQTTLNDAEKKAFYELVELLQKKDRSYDPRIQFKIEGILSDYPNLMSYLKN